MIFTMDRIDLQKDLENILGSDEVHFQPPANIKMTYPCIVYHRLEDRLQFADNKLYFRKKKYNVTVITRDADSDIPDKVLNLRYTSHERNYISDNLYHSVYTVHL